MTGERWRPQYRIAEAVVIGALVAVLPPLAAWLVPGWHWAVVAAGIGGVALIYGVVAAAVYTWRGTYFDHEGRLDRVAGWALAMATGPVLFLPGNIPATFGLLAAECSLGLGLVLASRRPSVVENEKWGRVKREVQRQMRDPSTFSGASLTEARRLAGVLDQHPPRRDLDDWAAALGYAQLIVHPARDPINGGAGPALRAWVDREREELDRERGRRVAP